MIYPAILHFVLPSYSATVHAYPVTHLPIYPVTVLLQGPFRLFAVSTLSLPKKGMSQRRFHLREGLLHEIVAIDQVLWRITSCTMEKTHWNDSLICSMVWYIYPQNWKIFGVNVGKYWITH